MEGALIVAGIMAGFLTWFSAVVSALLQPGAAWLKTGRSKVAWVIGLLLIGTVAAVYYWLVVRPKLVVAGRNLPRVPGEAPVTVPKRKEEWGDPWS